MVADGQELTLDWGGGIKILIKSKKRETVSSDFLS